MKTRLNLGLAHRDSHGSLIVTLQSIPVGQRGAIISADYVDGHCVRFLVSTKARQNTAAFHPSAFRVAAEDCAQPDSVKSLEWAYPTSDNACAFGFGATGCWTINLGRKSQPLHAVRAFPDDQKDYALSICRDLPFAWCPFCAHINPQYVEATA